ncbi:DUF547 domain-containing protein [Erythrobacter sp. JK5]|nr:DUF547 domain-containing protein [Erythrobacter sp. JK5]
MVRASGIAAAIALVTGPAGARDSAVQSGLLAPSTQAPNSEPSSQDTLANSTEPLAMFAPGRNPIDHTIDYSIWSEALSYLVVSMGPSLRKKPQEFDNALGTRRRFGHNSRYRLEGSLVGFTFMNDEVKASFTEYRRDLESVADTLDIQSLPRNEQLAYWMNLHNVAMVEQIARAWPIRQPREILLDGVPLDEAKFITVRGIALSPRDIRTRIVYPNWRNPKVIYGFWRGEIGGPALQRKAFQAAEISNLLDRSAREFVNSLRGVQKYGGTMQVSTVFAEAAPFYFGDFERDLRSHIGDYANQDVAEILDRTDRVDASVYEHDIADLSGGARANAWFSNGQLGRGVSALLAQRQQKFEYMEREGLRTGTVTFSNINLPGDSRDKGEVE